MSNFPLTKRVRVRSVVGAVRGGAVQVGSNISPFFLSHPLFRTCFEFVRVFRGLELMVWVFCFPKTVQSTQFLECPENPFVFCTVLEKQNVQTTNTSQRRKTMKKSGKHREREKNEILDGPRQGVQSGEFQSVRRVGVWGGGPRGKGFFRQGFRA